MSDNKLQHVTVTNPAIPDQQTSVAEVPPSHLPTRIQERSRRRGCAPVFWVIGILLLVPLLLAGIGLLIYLIFPPPPVDILVMGLDSRGAEGVVARTDSIMLLGVNPGNLAVSQLSIPRDLFIDVPYYGMQRINTINVLGEQDDNTTGPQLLGESIRQNFDVQVDRYVRINFQAFVELIDAVGGVDVYVERILVDNAYPTIDGGTMAVRFESGQQTLDGERALIYSRIRHPDDDYRRAERQQQVVSALVAKLAQPQYWLRTLEVMNQNLETNLSFFDLIRIAPPIILSGGRFDQLVIDRGYIQGTNAGYAVPNYDLVLPWVNERFD